MICVLSIIVRLSESQGVEVFSASSEVTQLTSGRDRDSALPVSASSRRAAKQRTPPGVARGLALHPKRLWKQLPVFYSVIRISLSNVSECFFSREAFVRLLDCQRLSQLYNRCT